MQHRIIGRRDGAVGRLVVNQPDKRNAVSLDMWQAAGTVLEDLASDDAVRVVVVAGAGGQAFVSGADISRFEEERASAGAVAQYDEVTTRVFDRLATLGKPTIAQIQGSCVGGGVGLAACCDLRICNASARFGIPAARLGVGYGYGGIKRLVDLIGPAFTKDVFFTARLFSADEALQMGLVNRVVPDDEIETYVADYAATIGDNAPLTIAAVKAIVGEALKDPRARDLALCERLVDACNASRDYVEGRRAFMEKRRPRFVGA